MIPGEGRSRHKQEQSICSSFWVRLAIEFPSSSSGGAHFISLEFSTLIVILGLILIRRSTGYMSLGESCIHRVATFDLTLSRQLPVAIRLMNLD